jgi:acetyl esterase/lipase
METETYRPARVILLGGDASPRLRRSTSLDTLVTPASPPFFVWHTAEDPYVPPEHTYRLASALAASGVPHAVHVFAHGPHSLGLAQGAGEAAIWTTLAHPWIHEQASPLGQTGRKGCCDRGCEADHRCRRQPVARTGPRRTVWAVGVAKADRVFGSWPGCS